MSTIVSRSKFELSDRELVVSRLYLLPLELMRRMQALADAAGRSLENEVVHWFDEQDLSDDEIAQMIESWTSDNK